MALKDYHWYIADSNAFDYVKKRMLEHFAQYPDCECDLWCARHGGVSDIMSIHGCDRCRVDVYVGSIKWSDCWNEILRQYIMLHMEAEGFVFLPDGSFDSGERFPDNFLNRDFFALCACCFNKLAGGFVAV